MNIYLITQLHNPRSKLVYFWNNIKILEIFKRTYDVIKIFLFFFDESNKKMIFFYLILNL